MNDAWEDYENALRTAMREGYVGAARHARAEVLVESWRIAELEEARRNA